MIFTGEVQVFKIDFSQVPRMASIRLSANSMDLARLKLVSLWTFPVNQALNGTLLYK